MWWTFAKEVKKNHGGSFVSLDSWLCDSQPDPLPSDMQQTSFCRMAPQTTHGPNELDSRGKHVSKRFWVSGVSGGRRLERAPIQPRTDMPTAATARRQTADVRWWNAQVVWHQTPQRVRRRLWKLLRNRTDKRWLHFPTQFKRRGAGGGQVAPPGSSLLHCSAWWRRAAVQAWLKAQRVC